MSNQRSPSIIRYLTVFGSIIALVALWGIRSGRDKDASVMAYNMIRGTVEDRLRAPATASFPDIMERGQDQHVTHHGDQRYTINGTDAVHGRCASSRRGRMAARVAGAAGVAQSTPRAPYWRRCSTNLSTASGPMKPSRTRASFWKYRWARSTIPGLISNINTSGSLRRERAKRRST